MVLPQASWPFGGTEERLYYPGFHPLRAVQLMRVGKLQYSQDMFPQALETLKQIWKAFVSKRQELEPILENSLKSLAWNGHESTFVPHELMGTAVLSHEHLQQLLYNFLLIEIPVVEAESTGIEGVRVQVHHYEPDLYPIVGLKIQAYNIMKVTHGTDHSLMKALMELKEECEAMMRLQ
ncbi:hypothetical protein TURU_062449 [Turdus rufiventris]|nr:hypothetical protein TURU_062449 [Turdus rufiventris]